MILIIGCGFLGQYVLKELLTKTNEHILCTYHTAKPKLHFKIDKRVQFAKCDVANEADLQALGSLCAGETLTVFYFAAYHNMDAVYHHPQQAQTVNVKALNLFLKTVKNIDKLYFSSTDCVYGESREGQAPFRESDTPAPINEYGRQKALAEKIFLENGYDVFRFSLLYGASLCEKQTFYDKTFSALKKGESVEMIQGLARNALPYEKAAQTVVKLAFACAQIPQILNICGDALLTKYDLGLRIAAAAGASRELVKPITEAEGQKFFAEKRASSIALDNGLLKQTINSNLSD